jgi:hypothetical protein
MQFSLKFPAFSDTNPIKRGVLPQLRGLYPLNLAESAHPKTLPVGTGF